MCHSEKNLFMHHCELWQVNRDCGCNLILASLTLKLVRRFSPFTKLLLSLFRRKKAEVIILQHVHCAYFTFHSHRLFSMVFFCSLHIQSFSHIFTMQATFFSITMDLRNSKLCSVVRNSVCTCAIYVFVVFALAKAFWKPLRMKSAYTRMCASHICPTQANTDSIVFDLS